ncbi:MAG: transporter [Bacilli bacterium]|nr:transporter [Acholeplasmataceae bacterium]
MNKPRGADKFRIQPLPEPPPFRPPSQSLPLRPPLPEFLPPIGGPSFGMQRFRRCLNRVSEISLRGGGRIWFYPTAIRNQNLIGFRWQQFDWVRSSIPLFRIRSIDCF